MTKSAIYPLIALLPLTLLTILITTLVISLFLYFKRRYPNDIVMGIFLAFSVGPISQFYIKDYSVVYFIFSLLPSVIMAFYNKSLIFITSTLFSAILLFIRMKYITPYWKGKYNSWMEIGAVLLTNGEYYPAIRYLKNALKDNPSGQDALCALGLCYAKLHKMDKSILFINKAADLGSEAAKEYLKTNSLVSK
jgi:tetratricopeptide (TPR) repeat protein